MTRRKPRGGAAEILGLLVDDPSAWLIAAGDGAFAIAGPAGLRGVRIREDEVRLLVSRGLLHEVEPRRFAAGSATAAWLKRESSAALPFRMQHGRVEAGAAGEEGHRDALVNLDESPVRTLARRQGRDGTSWLPAHSVASAERLRRDFEIGQLQPRVTANWSASVNTGRRVDGGSEASLTDIALAARLRFDRAMRDVGPELAGILVDVCCFLKGLETVERERQWPARSAKLVLRIALETLARHYGLSSEATGNRKSQGIRGWGADGYRPQIS